MDFIVMAWQNNVHLVLSILFDPSLFIVVALTHRPYVVYRYIREDLVRNFHLASLYFIIDTIQIPIFIINLCDGCALALAVHQLDCGSSRNTGAL